ncbi:hypothetical protein EN844_27020 [Mesorhizobium sp. M3A.F.Ca.ET.201.01.1.1]|uniref:hypothetical protein n=2 Tax=Mesorhizobium TaxID=68287 RepID=UPI0010940987|nr:hypothetical protein [Mesorhizobium sp. M3A.F.Ca.ET.201.01.1.1]TGS62024.1 hypothetical protein EN844_27020 [Mesorhizobium sp. M3A.F.Ca.ET.201.01.1.1]
MHDAMTRSSLHLLKGLGYSISTASVVLLTIVSWQHASQNPLLIVCLLGGTSTSVIGMFCRWLSYEIEHRQEERRDHATGQRPTGPVNHRPAASTMPSSPQLRD